MELVKRTQNGAIINRLVYSYSFDEHHHHHRDSRPCTFHSTRSFTPSHNEREVTGWHYFFGNQRTLTASI
ncbi:hypothetical protein M413DRAFT_149155 [Hebeloma cylindrosporum]|uniref:Uncharacterized protein n=1 Tax=Hebeloma cylindrosporum TaxID=76867 RepID=A0A0C2YK89_HEBCY|nr:hypothetical protein M413DRAFT_149155 [Hebeloma cylindrosporum h7]